MCPMFCILQHNGREEIVPCLSSILSHWASSSKEGLTTSGAASATQSLYNLLHASCYPQTVHCWWQHFGERSGKRVGEEEEKRIPRMCLSVVIYHLLCLQASGCPQVQSAKSINNAGVKLSIGTLAQQLYLCICYILSWLSLNSSRTK